MLTTQILAFCGESCYYNSDDLDLVAGSIGKWVRLY
jgi:hypothetical protein